MLRDIKHKDINYFQEEKQYYINRLKKTLAIESEILEENMSTFMLSLGLINKSLFKICYSIGDSTSDIFKYFKHAVNYHKEWVYEGTGLYSVIDYFALGVLYSNRKEEFIEDLKIIQKKMTHTDDIIEYYMAYLLDDKAIPYHSVFEYQNMIEDTFESVKKAQGLWYDSHSDAVWYDSHKRSSYEGYWSFDTAATCKVKGIFDERLKDLEYFPYDLLVQE